MKFAILVMITIIVIFLTWFILLGGINSQVPNGKNQSTILEVELHVIAPFSKARLWLDRHGVIDYEASSNEGVIESDILVISTQQFQELEKLIFKSNFLTFQKDYPSNASDKILTDTTAYTLTITSFHGGGKGTPATVTTSNCSDACPQELLDIVKKVKELWGRGILGVGV